MKYDEMTFQQRRRFKDCKCPICGERLSKFDDVQITQVRYGRRIFNFYMHSSCLLNTLLPSQLEEGGLYEEAIH